MLKNKNYHAKVGLCLFTCCFLIKEKDETVICEGLFLTV
jgi:hypothetical protein